MNSSTQNRLTASFSLAESFSCVTSTILFFFLLNQIATKVLKSISANLATHSNFWRFKNTSISWLHSILATVLVTINVIQAPALFSDMINTSTKISYVTICISTGYFIYDAFDIIFSNKKLSQQSQEVLLHHFVIIFIFWVPLITNQFVGYTIAALSIEINTVFLHLRFMLVFNNVDKNSLTFRSVSILNIITFLMFRILTLCWMTRWIVLNRRLIHVVWFSVGSFGLAVMMLINIFLFQRLLQSDFVKNKANKAENTESNKTENSMKHAHTE